MSRRPRLAALCAVVIVAALALPAGAQARNGYKAIWGPVTRAGLSQFPLYHDLGVQIWQDGLPWASIAPTRPRHPTDPRDRAYHWPADLSQGIREAARFHMRVLLLAIETPPWANGGRTPNYAPSRVKYLTDFLTAAQRKYPTVHLWMIWGEASRQPNFAPMTPASPTATRLTRAQAAAPRRYAQLLDASYATLKKLSRANLVIGGNTYTTGDIPTYLWIRYMRLPNGKPPRLDLYGHNPFSFFREPNLSNPPSPDGEVDFSDLGRLARTVDRNLAPRHRHIKLFLSEWTLPTAPGDDEFNFWLDPPVAAQWISDAWRIVRANSFIYGLGWIHVYDDPPGMGSTGGLLDYLGVPKPSYGAFKSG